MLHLLLQVLSALLFVALITFCSFKFSFKVKKHSITNIVIISAAITFVFWYITNYFLKLQFFRGNLECDFGWFYLNRLPDHIYDWVTLTLLLALYLFHNGIFKLKTHKYLSILFFGLGAPRLIYIFIVNPILYGSEMIMLYFSRIFPDRLFFSFIPSILFIVASVLLWIKHPKSTTFAIIAATSYSPGLFDGFLYNTGKPLAYGSFFWLFQSIIDYGMLNFDEMLYIISNVLIIASLLLVTKNSDLPQPALTKIIHKQPVLSPEAELKLLKEKLELGAITEEEYAAQRAKIISKL